MQKLLILLKQPFILYSILRMKKKAICITGLSGSGKSSYARILYKTLSVLFVWKKIQYIDIDKLFHKELELNKKEVCKIVGIDNFENRKELGKILFNNEKLHKEVSDLLYKNVCVKILNIVELNDICILDYILIPFMIDLCNLCGVRILIEAPQDIRFARIMKRDNVSIEYIKLRESKAPKYNKSMFDFLL